MWHGNQSNTWNGPAGTNGPTAPVVVARETENDNAPVGILYFTIQIDQKSIDQTSRGKQ